MRIKTSQFIMSNSDYKQCPKPVLPEYAFIGRSNVGKSSLINALTGRNKLAKVSSTPGKTQLINHFLINQDWYLVDLPGYGYAKVSKKTKAAFEPLIETYLKNRENLFCTFVLVDIRHEPQKADVAFLEWMGEQGLPFAIIFTKADKLKPAQAEASIRRFQDFFLQTWEEMPPYFLTSSAKKQGLDDILQFIDSVNAEYGKELRK